MPRITPIVGGRRRCAHSRKSGSATRGENPGRHLTLICSTRSEKHRKIIRVNSCLFVVRSLGSYPSYPRDGSFGVGGSVIWPFRFNALSGSNLILTRRMSNFPRNLAPDFLQYTCEDQK